MMILAIDPGSEQSGYVLYDDFRRKIIDVGKVSNERMRNYISDSTKDLKNNDFKICIEFPEPRGQLASSQLFHTCRWVGILQTETHGLPVDFVNRTDVLEFFEVHKRTRKEKAAGIKKVAADTQIRAKIIEMFGGENAVGKKKTPGPLYGVKADAWQALAIALMVAGESE